MTSTRLSQQSAGSSLSQQADAQSREPTLLRTPSIDLESAGLDEVSIGADIFSPQAPIVGKTVNVSGMDPLPYTLPSDFVLPKCVLDPIPSPETIKLSPPGARVDAVRGPRSLTDIVLRRPPAPIWMESEMLETAYAPAVRVSVSGKMLDVPGPVVLPTGEILHAPSRVAPSSLYLTHFGAAIVAAVARGDADMQARRMLPTITVNHTSGLPVQHGTVVLYANTGGGKLAPIAINTDARVHMTHDGELRALPYAPMAFDLTYPLLESAFAKLIAAGGAYTFKPFDPLYRATNVDAIGHALSAITANPTSVANLHDLAQTAVQEALADRHAAVIITFPPNHTRPVRTGDVPEAQWKTYASAPTQKERASGVPAPEHTFLADIPYVVTGFSAATGHVELVNVLKQSPDSSWYEADAKNIHQALVHQPIATMRVPLALLRSISGVQIFSSKIAYAVPAVPQQRPQAFVVKDGKRVPQPVTPQGEPVVMEHYIDAVEADKIAHLRIRDSITAKLIEGARQAFAHDPINVGPARLLAKANVSVKDDLITLRHTDSDDVMAYLLRTGNDFCWFLVPNVPFIRHAIKTKQAQVSALRDCLVGIAQHVGVLEAPRAEEPQAEVPQARASQTAAPQIEVPQTPPVTAISETPKLAPPSVPAVSPITVTTPITAISEAARTALRDPNVPVGLIGNDIPVQDLSPQLRRELGAEDTRPWYTKAFTRNPNEAVVIDSSALPREAVERLGTFKPQANSVYFKPLTEDLAAPSRIQTSHFAAAIMSACTIGVEPFQRALTLRSLAQTAADAAGKQWHTVALYTAEGESGALIPTPINVSSEVFTAPDGTVRAPRFVNRSSQHGRLPYEGSSPYHGYAVLENAFQKLAAQAGQYVFKPFESQSTWDNVSAISHALSAVTGSATRVTTLAWDGTQDNHAAWWPQSLPSDLNLMTFPGADDMPSSGLSITHPTPFEDTPSIFVHNAENSAVLLSNVPYVVRGMAGPAGDSNPAHRRVLLHNVLATSNDPSWYENDAPSLGAILARQAIAPASMQVSGEPSGKKAMLTLSLEAVRRVGATVYKSALRVQTASVQGQERVIMPLQPRYADAQQATAEGVRDVIAQLPTDEKSAAFKAWAATLAFTVDSGQHARTLVHVRQGGKQGNIIASFVRSTPGEPVLPEEAERLLPRLGELNAQMMGYQASHQNLAVAARTGQISPAQAQLEQARIRALVAQMQPEGADIDTRVQRGRAAGLLPLGGVRRLKDGLPGVEVTPVKMLQDLFAEVHS